MIGQPRGYHVIYLQHSILDAFRDPVEHWLLPNSHHTVPWLANVAHTALVAEIKQSNASCKLPGEANNSKQSNRIQITSQASKERTSWGSNF
jgi:hypothetical protein